jgi:transcriptional regulator with XRE-family HTH domain
LNRFALTEWRVARGLSKSQLAVEAQISLGYLCDLEKGHRSACSPPVLKRLADALKVNQLALIGSPREDVA